MLSICLVCAWNFCSLDIIGFIENLFLLDIIGLFENLFLLDIIGLFEISFLLDIIGLFRNGVFLIYFFNFQKNILLSNFFIIFIKKVSFSCILSVTVFNLRGFPSKLKICFLFFSWSFRA